MSFTRRQFVQSVAVSAGFGGLGRWAWAQRAPGPQPYLNEADVYGPLISDPKRLLDLPKGFSYTVLSRTGDPMADGFRVPGAPDGMAAFAAPNGRVIIVRNHELEKDQTFNGPFGVENELFAKLNRAQVYDAGYGRPHLGGTSTIVYDPAANRVEKMFLSLVGTARNCAGGPTPWNSWITCEENVDVKDAATHEQNHGYAFDVPATTAIGLAKPVPLPMGRFYREAVAVDPRTSIVYQSEDRDDGLLYRFVPNIPRQLHAGGRVQALALRDRAAADTRNWAELAQPRIPIGSPLPVRWIDIDQPDTVRDDLRARGFARGAARFARGEGMWFGSNEFYLGCTNGGLSQRGQIFRYKPSPAEGTPAEETSPGQIELYLEPNNVGLLESCDNVTVAPWGHLFICEDDAAPTSDVVRDVRVNYVRGVTPAGKMYTIARNRYEGNSELAGICFAPDHPTMFINIQSPGITFAVTGPWNGRASGV